MTDDRTPGQAAYEAYVAAKPHGETALDWDETDGAYQAAWEAAVQAALPVVLAGAAQYKAERDEARERFATAREPLAEQLDEMGVQLISARAERDRLAAELEQARAAIPQVMVRFDHPVTGETAGNIRESIRAALNEPAIGQAAAINSLTGQLAAVRERLGDLADAMDLTAAVTEPSKKSQIERQCAAAIREALEDIPYREDAP